jgi:hypothetical protein
MEVVSHSEAQSSANMKLDGPTTEFDDTPLDLSVDCWSMVEPSQIETLLAWSTHPSHSCGNDFVENQHNSASWTPDMSHVEERLLCVPSITFDENDPSDLSFHYPGCDLRMGLYNQDFHEPVPLIASSSSVNVSNETYPADSSASWNQCVVKATHPDDGKESCDAVGKIYPLNNGNHDDTVKTFPSERSDLDLSNFSESPEEASRVLLFLGSTLRSKADRFVDASTLVDPRGNMRRPQGKELFFPDRLYLLLEMSETRAWTDIVSFQPHGRSFRVHDKAQFVEKLLPICLQGQGSWSSFLRQLRLYGFTRCESGPDYGAYYHELFLRGRPSLTRYMRRVGVSHGGLDRRTFRLQKGSDPDFYSQYPPMPPLNATASVDSQSGL